MSEKNSPTPVRPSALLANFYDRYVIPALREACAAPPSKQASHLQRLTLRLEKLDGAIINPPARADQAATLAAGFDGTTWAMKIEQLSRDNLLGDAIDNFNKSYRMRIEELAARLQDFSADSPQARAKGGLVLKQSPYAPELHKRLYPMVLYTMLPLVGFSVSRTDSRGRRTNEYRLSPWNCDLQVTNTTQHQAQMALAECGALTEALVSALTVPVQGAQPGDPGSRATPRHGGCGRAP